MEHLKFKSIIRVRTDLEWNWFKKKNVYVGIERYDDDDGCDGDNDIVLIDRENKIALVTDIVVPFTHKLSRTEAENIMKYKHLALEIKNIRKLNNVSLYLLVISVEGAVTKNFLIFLENIRLTKTS